MATVITIANPKGGTAKTTTVVNLCAALSATRRRILLLDLDPQCSATTSLGFARNVHEQSLAGVLIAGNSVKDCIKKCDIANFDIAVANEDLTAVPVAIYNDKDSALKLRQALDEIKDDYDLVIIDTPASLNLLTINALCSSDKLIIPVSAEYFSLDSTKSLLDLAQGLKEQSLCRIELLGILRTMFDEDIRLSRLISHELTVQFGSALFSTIIPFNHKNSESQASGRPLIFYDKSSAASLASLAFAGEVLQKLKSTGYQ